MALLQILTLNPVITRLCEPGCRLIILLYMCSYSWILDLLHKS
ncbi:hypothetical protein NC651_022091 [Populus alba x Populus x berolinensis]|nr:hypothetical protein NC651_021502 [Populus alba x Populus x berolinensis]KAJ6895727.1 hypothetical protein NC651_022065 [Populus alba x Populus x berolinensis]KAJ6895742.1 hypothetical protein NC651_022078 [Populus alba x Populus x berolinensis]KAJ6895755.1 hypothetical protein NC651_022091 [Populus alba x Populus x berolinensis]